MDFVLYGERGVGKTSLWEILLHGQRIQQHSASASDDFVSIFLRVLEELKEQFTDDERTRMAEVTGSIGKEGVASVGGKSGEEATEKPVAERKLDLNFVLDRVARRANSLDAVVIDEFQNLSKHAIQTQIIEVVKGFADRKVDVKIFLVGVADSDDELIPSQDYAQDKGRHFFIRRVPRMSDSELHDILDVRERLFRSRSRRRREETASCASQAATPRSRTVWHSAQRKAMGGEGISGVRPVPRFTASSDFSASVYPSPSRRPACMSRCRT